MSALRFFTAQGGRFRCRLAKYRDNAQNPSISAVSWFHQLRWKIVLEVGCGNPEQTYVLRDNTRVAMTHVTKA